MCKVEVFFLIFPNLESNFNLFYDFTPSYLLLSGLFIEDNLENFYEFFDYADVNLLNNNLLPDIVESSLLLSSFF